MLRKRNPVLAGTSRPGSRNTTQPDHSAALAAAWRLWGSRDGEPPDPENETAATAGTEAADENKRNTVKRILSPPNASGKGKA